MAAHGLESNILPPLNENIPIRDFFKGKSVFVTGGAGFMGKVLIEKLLWSCEDINNIYILLRPKRNKSVKQRLQKLLDLEMFDRIRNKNPKILEKIVPVEGDASECNLGMTCEDVKMLEDNVSVIFHFAATVKFTEPVKQAVLLNVRGTREVVYLARNMKNLQALVHVSTMYANTDKTIIEEKVYTNDADWRTAIKVAETIDNNVLNSLQDKIKGYHPNTYTYTKYLAENVVNEYRHEIPVIIFRPSIVSNSLIDPIPGWIDSFNGASGMWITIITGILHIALAKGSGINDYIPCDFCANALIISAWYRGDSKQKDCITINAASGDRKEINPSYLFDLAYQTLQNVPFEKMLWEPAFYTTQNYYLYMFLVFVLHVIPGLFFEALLKIAGVKFSILAVYRKIFVINDVLKYFLMNQWEIVTKNYYTLNSYIHPDDKGNYVIDMSTINNIEAAHVGLRGIKKFILKEELTEEAMKRARKTLNRVKMANLVLKIIVFIISSWTLYKVAAYSAHRLGAILY